MKRKIPEEIFAEITQAVEQKGENNQIFRNLQISIHSTLKEDTTKESIKRQFISKYGRPVAGEYLTTVEVHLTEEEETIKIVNQSLFIGGRYRKNRRNISNTPMYTQQRITREKKEEEKKEEKKEGRMPAVSDWMEPFLNYFNGDKVTFISGGREDYDVRMLGNGRPFLCCVENPTSHLPRKVGVLSTVIAEEGGTKEEYSEIYKPIEIPYSLPVDVELLHLHLADGPKAKKEIKQAEETHSKTYRVRATTHAAAATVQQRIEETHWEKKDSQYVLNRPSLLLQQKTPIRVLHRRANIVRDKILYRCTIERVEETAETEKIGKTSNSAEMTNSAGSLANSVIVAEIDSSSGTYIKEFINGDMGRTSPSLSEIVGGYCDVVELDVLSVEDDFPREEHILAPVHLKREEKTEKEI